MEQLSFYPAVYVLWIPRLLLPSAAASSFEFWGLRRSEWNSYKVKTIKITLLRYFTSVIIKKTRSWFFWCHTRLKVCRHGRKLQLQNHVVVVLKDYFRSHPLRREVLVEQSLYVGPTSKYSSLAVNKWFPTFWVVTFFVSLFIFRPRRVCRFRSCASLHQDLFFLKTFWEQLWDYNDIFLLKALSIKPSFTSSNKARSGIRSIYNYQRLRLIGISFRRLFQHVLDNPALKTFRPSQQAFLSFDL